MAKNTSCFSSLGCVCIYLSVVIADRFLYVISAILGNRALTALVSPGTPSPSKEKPKQQPASSPTGTTAASVSLKALFSPRSARQLAFLSTNSRSAPSNLLQRSEEQTEIPDLHYTSNVVLRASSGLFGNLT